MVLSSREPVTLLPSPKRVVVDGSAVVEGGSGSRPQQLPYHLATEVPPSTTLSFLSSRSEAEGSAVRHSGAPNLSLYNRFPFAIPRSLPHQPYPSPLRGPLSPSVGFPPA